MTIDRSKTIEMAREAGIEMEHIVFRSSHASLERFAALVRAQVLEEAAQRLEQLRDEHCTGTAMADDPADQCTADDQWCEFVTAWNNGAAALRGMKSDSGHSTARAGEASTAPLPDVPGATSGAEPVWCGCGDGITPDTGAKCWICVADDAAEIESLRAAAQCWQPIETAPKDGTRILVMCHHGDIEISEWYEHWYERYEEAGNGLYRKVREKTADGWNSNVPTHWMPLPSAPKEA